MRERWKKAKLGDVAEVQTGPFGSQLHQKDYVQIGTPIITVEHLGENHLLHVNLPKVSNADKQRLCKYTLKEGDIVFSRVGSVDRRAYVKKEEDGWLFSGRCLRVRPISDQLDSRYLSSYFGLNSFKKYIRAIAVGSTMPSLNTTILSEIEIPLPPLSTQRRIAAILSALDDKIELNRRTNQTLEAVAQALFKEWFVDFNFPGATGEMQESELGPIPVGWKAAKWGELLSLEYGKCLRNYTDGTGPHPVFGTNGKIGMHTDPLCPHPGIIIGRKGAYRGVHFSDSPFFVIDTAFFVKPGVPMELRWAYYEMIALDINGMDSGSAIPSTSREDFYRLPVIAPPIAIQQAFTRLLTPSWQTQQHLQRESQTLSSLRDALLPKLMNGEITV